ncbi:uncharacterized protein B0H64DRAFT_175880 [Chaetomium fimeti]|uniref:Uncharacterized protein n=1 Tax=Chaetomium fimeti TaxID=1854472 RepID=A0AAE0HCE5_9PEZI|nr:hypothetical protein B0H64DRAFT_175880 [Chaetomium fimeti]
MPISAADDGTESPSTPAGHTRSLQSRALTAAQPVSRQLACTADTVHRPGSLLEATMACQLRSAIGRRVITARTHISASSRAARHNSSQADMSISTPGGRDDRRKGGQRAVSHPSHLLSVTRGADHRCSPPTASPLFRDPAVRTCHWESTRAQQFHVALSWLADVFERRTLQLAANAPAPLFLPGGLALDWASSRVCRGLPPGLSRLS